MNQNRPIYETLKKDKTVILDESPFIKAANNGIKVFITPNSLIDDRKY